MITLTVNDCDGVDDDDDGNADDGGVATVVALKRA